MAERDAFDGHKRRSTLPIQTESVSADPPRLNVGIWLELPSDARWANEGMPRLIGFMIEGAAQHNGPRFHLIAQPALAETIDKDLRTLKARPGVDWVVHRYDHRAAARRLLSKAPGYGSTVRKLAKMDAPTLGRTLSRYGRIVLPLAWLRSAVRGRPLDIGARLDFLRKLRDEPHSHLETVGAFIRGLPFAIGRRVADDVERWHAYVKAEREMASPEPAHDAPEVLAAMAAWADAETPVDGWVVLYPFFRGARHLKKPRAAIFPDAIPLTFPTFIAEHWGDQGAWTNWRTNSREALLESPAVITFSRHAAHDSLNLVIKGNRPPVYVIPHAPIDISGQLSSLDPLEPGGDATSRLQAGGLLREHAGRHGPAYLRGFPFEEVPYIAMSTQDRASKNLVVVAEAIDHLVRNKRRNVKLITTASIHFGETWTRFPNVLESRQLLLDVCSMSDLARPAHAALYHCAQLTVHPSLFEGGDAPFPFYESLSVGCPCIMARGPHTEELAGEWPELLPYIFDAFDPKGLARLIDSVMADRAKVLRQQQVVLARMRRRTWADVARAYAAAATHTGAPRSTTYRE